MALRSAPLWLVVLVAVGLRESCCGASSHSLKYFFTSISDPNQGQPQHVAVGFVDDQVFIHYDSHSRRMKPRVSWMEKVDPNYWDRNTQMARDTEEASKGDLETLRLRYNQSKRLRIRRIRGFCDYQEPKEILPTRQTTILRSDSHKKFQSSLWA